MLLRHASERRRFLRFAVVGTLGAAVDFGVFNALRASTSLSPVVCSVLSFTAAVLHNFLWNRYWTYPESRSKPLWRQGLQFFALNAIGAAIRTPLFAWWRGPLVAWMTRWNPPLPLSPQTLGENLALALVMVVILFWNFFSNRYLTYNDVDIGA